MDTFINTIYHTYNECFIFYRGHSVLKLTETGLNKFERLKKIKST